MGLLDDAIREHLELKRRAGADPQEVARQEQEALGPARRGPEPLEVSRPAQDEAADPHAPAIDEDVAELETVGEAPVAEPLVEWDEPEPVHEPVEPEPEPAAPPPEPVAAEAEPLVEQPIEPEPEPEPEPESAAQETLYEAPGDVDQPTVAFDAADVEEARRRPEPAAPVERDAPEPEPDAEDVLEETPDFLQETPEHDRLWFEQRPPRDFDFDG